ncbi:hypothetical protein XENOCAPTIV_009493 [Xenoophorus captivus]|uniref:Uncharacterized protein n=1 Tax=Xenoophorus captivus TaxID=1517983 RepID=A0ABV0RIK3_9TELE
MSFPLYSVVHRAGEKAFSGIILKNFIFYVQCVLPPKRFKTLVIPVNDLYLIVTDLHIPCFKIAETEIFCISLSNLKHSMFFFLCNIEIAPLSLFVEPFICLHTLTSTGAQLYHIPSIIHPKASGIN